MLQNLSILKFKTQRNHLLTTWTWCGKKKCSTWRGTYNQSSVCIHPTCTNLGIYKQWTKPWRLLMEWNIYKWVLSQENVKMPRIQNHLGFLARHHHLHLKKKKTKRRWWVREVHHHLLHPRKKTNKWRQTKETCYHLLHMRKKKRQQAS